MTTPAATPHRCRHPHCTASFADEAELARHVVRCAGEPATQRRPIILDRVHTDEDDWRPRRFRCPEPGCDEFFAERQHLQEHEHQHARQRARRRQRMEE